MQSDFDFVVIGAGMFGASAAKYLSEKSSSVALVGPGEPNDRSSDVFSSHYDETRIYRYIGIHLLWSVLAKRSINRFDEIKEQSGIDFFNEKGFMMLSPGKFDADWFNLNAVQKISDDLAADVDVVDEKIISERYPQLSISPGTNAIIQKSGAGYLNPRKLLKAQKKIALNNGLAYFDTSVLRMEKLKGLIRLEMKDGSYLLAKKVLLAVGSETNTSDLMPRKLDMKTHGFISMLSEVSADYNFDVPPCLYAKDDGINPYWGIMFSAVNYPDGKKYIKTMGDFYGRENLNSHDDIKDWFQADISKSQKEKLIHDLKGIVPGAPVKSYRYETAIFPETPSAYPYIDMVDDNIAVAAGCNGRGAKSSDEIGRIAADLIFNGKWSDGTIPPEPFKSRYLN